MYLDNKQLEYIRTELEKLATSGRDYALYGTGRVALEIIHYIEDMKLRRPAFVTDHIEWGNSKFCGIPFVSIADIRKSNVVFLLGTNVYYGDMLGEIKKYIEAPEILKVPAPALFTAIPNKPDASVSDLFTMLDEELILSKIHALLSNVAEYSAAGTFNALDFLLKRLRFHKFKLPSEVIICDELHKNYELSLGVKAVQPSDANQTYPIVIIDKTNAGDIKKWLREKGAGTAIIDLFSDSLLNYSPFSSDEIPFICGMNFSVSTTSSCNLSCSYCPGHSKLQQTKIETELWNKQIDRDRVFNVLEDVRGYISSLSLSGIGEPLLSPDNYDFIEFAKKNKVAETVWLQTNGLLLTRDKTLRFIDSGLDFLAVSVDSPAGKKALCRPYLPDNVIDNLEFFSKTTGIPVQISLTPVQGDNLFENLEFFLKLKERIPTLEKIVLNSLLLYPHLHEALEIGNIRPFSYIETLKNRNMIERLSEQHGVKIYMDAQKFPPDRNWGAICPVPWLIKNPFSCLLMHVDGRFSICPAFQLLLLDNIFDKGFIGAMNGERIRLLRKEFLRGIYPEVCKCLCGYESCGKSSFDEWKDEK